MKPKGADTEDKNVYVDSDGDTEDCGRVNTKYIEFIARKVQIVHILLLFFYCHCVHMDKVSRYCKPALLKELARIEFFCSPGTAICTSLVAKPKHEE